jgi:N-acetylneuraminate synthase
MTVSQVMFNGTPVGGPHVYFIAEIGINHNGDLDIAKKLIDVASFSGCDAVKFQKRTPDICVPERQKSLIRETPWGEMTYLEYRHRVEFGEDEYAKIDRYCRDKGITWTASPWDIPSAEFLEAFDVPFFKIASATLTNDDLVRRCAASGKPVVMSTGMSTMDEIRHAVSLLDPESTVLLHCTSTYPSQPADVNLAVMQTLRDEFRCPVGYSGHETGLQVSLAAVALGANVLERHITLDRAMWGSDQAASLEPGGLSRLVRDVRVIEAAMGDGEKTVCEGELKMRDRLRNS